MAASHSWPLKSNSKVKSKSRCEEKREKVVRGRMVNVCSIQNSISFPIWPKAEHRVWWANTDTDKVGKKISLSGSYDSAAACSATIMVRIQQNTKWPHHHWNNSTWCWQSRNIRMSSTHSVFLIGLHGDAAGDFLSPPHRQVVLQVKHCLFPVGVGSIWCWDTNTTPAFLSDVKKCKFPRRPNNPRDKWITTPVKVNSTRSFM